MKRDGPVTVERNQHGDRSRTPLRRRRRFDGHQHTSQLALQDGMAYQFEVWIFTIPSQLGKSTKGSGCGRAVNGGQDPLDGMIRLPALGATPNRWVDLSSPRAGAINSHSHVGGMAFPRADETRGRPDRELSR